MDQKRLYLIFGLIVVALIWCFHQNNKTVESFDTFKAISAEHYLPNSNAFKNYYRVGYEQSKAIGWKPSENWDHLRPEYSECPDCFRVDKIYDE